MSLITTDIDQKFIPIQLDSIRIDSVLNFDLYLNINRNLVLYRSADLPFTDRTRQKLMENSVEKIYITTESKQKYQLYIEKNLDKIIHDPTIPEIKKAGILYESSTGLVKEILSRPTYGENIKRSKHLVGNTIDYILKGQEAFHSLMKISSFDYYTYTHSVNVCTFSIALAQQMGFHDKEFLFELGVGALLHDVGKSKVSERILHKRAALNSIEFEIMKKHPKWGDNLMREANEISEASMYPILQHHERGDRSGYPNEISLNEMHIFSKIVAIADSFDAMTTERVYQQARDTFPALKVMLSVKGMYDDDAMKAFVELMGPKGLDTI